MKKDIYWEESECLSSWLHRFITLRVFPEGVEEICEICKERIFIPVKDGRIDNIEYIKYHKRELLFPQHPYFNHEYAKQH